jgi:tripartite-type tricarboxylate transporter receptor subunit TctC
MMTNKSLIFSARLTGWALAPCLAAGLLAPSGAVLAQTYPAKPIRVIMPTAPGSPPDHALRVLATRMAEGIGQPVIVENRGGAGGTLGAAVAAKAAPDGYTLMMGSPTSLSIGPAMFPSAGIDPVKMFAPISQVAVAPSVISVPVSLPVNTLQEFAKLIRSNPGKYNYASPAAGSPPHISTALFLRTLDLNMVHVPFGDPAKAVVAVLNGDAHLFIETLASIRPQVRAGKMKLLAVAASKRSPFEPDLPTVAETGLPSFESGTWSGLLAPVGTPPAIIGRLNAETHKAADTKELRAVMEQQGGEVQWGTPEQFGRLIAEEAVKWAKAVALSGAKTE